jgi:hypothetical protein
MNKNAMRIVCTVAALAMLVGFFWVIVYMI